MDLTIIIPYFEGMEFMPKLLSTIPSNISVIVVDDQSKEPYRTLKTERVIRPAEKKYFTGAINVGIRNCTTDVLILNQDTWFSSSAWLTMLQKKSERFAFIGESIQGNHPAFPSGYIHGTFMYVSRKVLQNVGLFNEILFPMWGSTAEFQWRVLRAGYKALVLQEVPGFSHLRGQGIAFGKSFKTLLTTESEKKGLFVRTPPLVSVIVPAYNCGKYLKDTVGCLLGGTTCLGKTDPQTFQAFEVIIVDDCSTDDTEKVCSELCDPNKGVHYIKLAKNVGAAAALNAGIEASHGAYITRIDGDDMRSPQSLEFLYVAQIENPHSFIYDDIAILRNGSLMKSKPWKMEDYDFERLIVKNQVHAGIMFPKKAWEEVGGYPAVMRDGREDWAINVALGIKGYCGVHINNPGYYYRREGQNRTIVNTSEEWRDRFVEQMKQLFPDIYAGRRPMGCCGGRKTVQRPVRGMGPSGASAQMSYNIPGASGMTLLEYVGANFGNQTYFGPVTGTAYVFNAGKYKIRNVDSRDVADMLSLRENTKALFKRHVPASTPVPASVQVSVPAVKVSTETKSDGITVAEISSVKKSVPSSDTKEEVVDTFSDLFKGAQLSTLDKKSLLDSGIKTVDELLKTDVQTLIMILGWKKIRVEAMLKLLRAK